jgi:hypothetical protein
MTRKPNGYYKDKSCVGTLDDGATPCPRSAIAKGMCMKHYQRLRLTNSLLPLPPKPTPNCSIPDCRRLYYARDYCHFHWSHWYKTGDPLQGTREQYLEKIKAQPVTCKVVCQGVRCDRRIGRGHGDDLNHGGSKAREYCGTHDARWLARGDVRVDDPIINVHCGPDSERPRCDAEDCDRPARGNDLYCEKHRQRVDNNGHLDLLRHSNIGLTCSNPDCDTVCKSGEDKFVRGMCAPCFGRFEATGTFEKSSWHHKREGNYRTCSVDECDGDETGDTTYCKDHWAELIYRPNGGQAASNAATRIYRALQYGAETDWHSIPELHAHWRARGIDPKRCTYCLAWYRKWKNPWKSSQGDHVLALKKGGSDMVDNIMPCCVSCNASKAARLLGTEWTAPKDRDNWSGWKHWKAA